MGVGRGCWRDCLLEEEDCLLLLEEERKRGEECLLLVEIDRFLQPILPSTLT
jgi:hypothetical protein